MEISLHKTISIHALREEGDTRPFSQMLALSISIHALREEGDWTTPPDYQAAVGNFYPRPPRGGRLTSATQIS